MGVRPWIGDFAAVRGDLLLILQMRSRARAHRNVRVAVFRDRSREIFSCLVIAAETVLGENLTRRDIDAFDLDSEAHTPLTATCGRVPRRLSATAVI